MEESSNRHRTGCAAAVVSLGGLIIAACSPAPGGPAPVYMMGMAGTATNEPAAVAAEPSMAPVALANWSDPPGSAAHRGSDVIPLDDPPQAAPPPARQTIAPAVVGAMPSAPTSMASAVPAATPASAAAPAAAPTADRSAGREPSAAEEARAEAAPPPVPGRLASEPARTDLVTATTGAARPAPYSRPSYYWP